MNTLLPKVLEALNFAALRHRRHRRKGREGAPYINHLIEVAHLLATHGVEDETTLVAAVLHDAVEDVSVTLDEVRQRFGDGVASLVAEVTDDGRLSFWQRKLAQVEGASSLSPAAQNLRVADKISNLRGILVSPPEHWSLQRKLAYYRWAKEVVSGCVLAKEQLRETFETIHASGEAALSLSLELGEEADAALEELQPPEVKFDK